TLHTLSLHDALPILAHIPEGRGLFPRLSVEDTLKLAVDAAGKPERLEAAYDVFPRLKQRRRQAVGTLSGGEQQMVAMARAILTRSEEHTSELQSPYE